MSFVRRFLRLGPASRVADGQRLLRARAVHLEHLGPRSAIARVKGSRPSPYVVRLAWEVAPGLFDVRAACSCPHFADRNLCKHIFAVLYALDAQPEPPVPGRQALRLVRDAELLRAAVEPAVPEPDEPAWKASLVALGDPAAQRAPSSRRQALAAAPAPQLWYVVDVPVSQAYGALTVQLYAQRPRADGTPEGRFVRAGLPFLRELESEDDREIVAILLGTQPAEDRLAVLTSPQDRGGYRVDAVLGDGFLPRLVATGRCVVRRQTDDTAPDLARPLAWDDSDPWRFQLEVVDQQGGARLRLAGTLSRGEQVVDLSAPLLITPEGWVLYRDTVSRLDASATAAFDWIALLRGPDPVLVPREDRDHFVETLARVPQLPPVVWPDGFAWDVRTGEPRGVVELGANGMSATGALHARVVFDYDGRRVDPRDSDSGAIDPAARTWVRRDAEREAALQRALDALALPGVSRLRAPDGELRIDRAQFPPVLSALHAHGWDVRARDRSVRAVTNWQFAVRSGIDWFDIDAACDYGGASAALPELLRAAASGEAFVRLQDGTLGMLPVDWLARFGPLVRLGELQGDRVRFGNSQMALLDALLAAQEVSADVDARFAQARQRLRAFDGVHPCAAPPGFTGQLRPYQEAGLGWLVFLREFGVGGCLADDMGLGKTVQVLALLERVRSERASKDARWPSLAVVPSSLVHNWIAEAERFTPELCVTEYTGPGRAARRRDWARADLVVTTYSILRRDLAVLRETEFEYVILDEAQAIKNATSLGAKASRLLRARHRLAVTGTPVENHLGELWSLFEFLNPGMLGASAAFRRVELDTASGVEPEWLARAVRPYVLRRTKERVLAELPAKTEQTLYCEMERKQRRLYDELRDHYRRSVGERVGAYGLARSRMHVLEALLRLRQAACHPGLVDPKRTGEPSAKLETLLSQLEEVLAEGHKALVFSQFTKLLAIVRSRLDERGIVYEYLDGRTRDRAARVTRFQSDAACPVFLVSLKAGGQGLNLTAADYVFLLDPWWNPAVEAQAIDRTHRIGQTRRVFAYRLLCKDTVEDKIAALQAHKRRLTESVLADDAGFLRRLTAEDLRVLLD